MSHVRFICTHCGAPNECLSKDIWCPEDNDGFYNTHARCSVCKQVVSWSAYGVDDLVKQHMVFRYTPIAPLTFMPSAPGV